MQLTKEQLDEIVEEAVNNNIVIYQEKAQDLIRLMCLESFILHGNPTFIEYVISEDFSAFDEACLSDNIIKRITITLLDRTNILIKFKEMGGGIVHKVCDSYHLSTDPLKYREWFFIFKTGGKHYFATVQPKE